MRVFERKTNELYSCVCIWTYDCYIWTKVLFGSKDYHMVGPSCDSIIVLHLIRRKTKMGFFLTIMYLFLCYSLRYSLFVLYSIFYFGISQNIVLFLKIKVINLLMYLVYPYFIFKTIWKKTNKYLKDQSNWDTFLVASLRATIFLKSW